MDQLRLHFSAPSMKAYQDHKFLVLKNVPYMPDFNPIESIFSPVKATFKALKTNQICNGERVPTRDTIEKAFSGIEKDFVGRCIDHAHRCLGL